MIKKNIKIALAGNPNSGKTTMFNALTGSHHKVGNYPGVTVEKKEGSIIKDNYKFTFIDLPGIYSLTAYSLDEVVTRDFLLDEKPDVIVDVLDSTNLERNLFLCLQFQELGIPVIAALNMSDEAEEKGFVINEEILSSLLKIPFIKTSGSKGTGIANLLEKIKESSEEKTNIKGNIYYGDEIESKLAKIENLIKEDSNFTNKYSSRWIAVKLLEKDSNAYERLIHHAKFDDIKNEVTASTKWLEGHFGKDLEITISEQRYGYIHGATIESVSRIKKSNTTLTQKIDTIVMNEFLALPIFIGVLWLMFQATFILGEYPMRMLELFFSYISNLVSNLLPQGLLQSLIVDGIIGGVGGVFSFVPLIIILFFLLSILEDIGYMSRAAFATDKFLHIFGLHGQSVFPMILGFGCSVPAIMAARTLKNPRDRIVTILIIPFISCGAKLPVYVLLAGAFFPNNAANIVMLLYLIGVILSLIVASILKKTILKGNPTPFVMELPPYRAPTIKGIIWHVWNKTLHYIKKAGTVILLASTIIWIVTNFPNNTLSDSQITTLTNEFTTSTGLTSENQISAYIQGKQSQYALENSFAGIFGKAIEPIFKPLGFDWRIGVATITGFAAKEIVVSTLGILYNSNTNTSESNSSLRDALQKESSFNSLTAFCLMLFILVIPPCFATLATIRSELGNRWLLFSFVFMFTIGWILTFIVYQIGSLLKI